MAMTALEFLDLIEQRGLLADELLGKLRRQVTGAKQPVTPAAILKLLIERGQLTEFQAQKLMGAAGLTESKPAAATPSSSPAIPAGESKAPAAEPKAKAAPTPKAPATPVDDELTLADDEDRPATPAPTREASPASDQAARTKSTPPARPAQTTPAQAPTPAAALGPLDELDDLFAAPAAAPAPSAGKPAGATSAPLDDLLDDPLAASGASAGSPLATKPKGKGLLGGLFGGGGAKKKKGGHHWDSPLMLVGGGGLILLCIVALVLYFALARGSGDELFAQAEQDYQSGAYGQAIAKYDKFISKNAGHPQESLARVRRGLARFREVVASNDPQRSLDSARQVLPEIEGEPQFSEARSELASLLPDIAAGFAEQARVAPDLADKERFVGRFNETMELVNNPNYLPGSLRDLQQARILRMQETIDAAIRDINRDKELEKAVRSMGEAVAARDTARAFSIRSALLATYPQLEQRAELQTATLDITKKLSELVTVVDEAIAASTEPDPPPRGTRVVLASRTGGSFSDLMGQIVYATAEGAVYALQASDGRVLWRRAVGYDSTSRPLAVGRAPGSDVIVHDTRDNEVVRLEAATGKVVWKLGVGEPSAEPVLVEDRVLVSARDGRLLQLDLATGNSPRQVRLPQPLLCSPGFDAQRREIYQLAEHSNLYILSADDLACREVVYIGHGAGGTPTPPVSVNGYLLVAENYGLDRSRLHVLALASGSEPLRRPQNPLLIQGQLVVPPVVYRGYVIYLTDHGMIHVLEVDPARRDEPVKQIAKRQAGPPALIATQQAASSHWHPFLDAGQLWVGGFGLCKYKFQPALGQISPEWTKFESDAIVAPLELKSRVLIHIRRRRGLPGITVAAARIDDGKDPASDGQSIWETHLAAGLAGEVSLETQPTRILAISALGELYEIGTAAMQAGLMDTPTIPWSPGAASQAFTGELALDSGKKIYFGPEQRGQVLFYDPADKSTPLRLTILKAPPGSVVAEPAVFASGIVIPLRIGQVLALDPRTGDRLPVSGQGLYPFQPRLEPATELAWSRAAVFDSAPPRFAIYDGQSEMYLVGQVDGPPPHLEALAQASLGPGVLPQLAGGSTGVYGVLRRSGGDSLIFWNVPKLDVQQEWPLTGRVTWGPERSGDRVLLTTDAEGLIACDTAGTRQWALPLDGPLAAPPVWDQGDLFVATIHGRVQRVAGNSGQVLTEINVGELLGRGLSVVATRLVLGASDGSLLIIDKPARPQ